MSPLSPMFPFDLRSFGTGKGSELHICLTHNGFHGFPGTPLQYSFIVNLVHHFFTFNFLCCFYRLNRVKDCIGTDLYIQERNNCTVEYLFLIKRKLWIVLLLFLIYFVWLTWAL